MVKAMEDHKNQFILILAGYPDEMDEFLSTNPGLPSRFPVIIDFPDYTVDQLVQIAGIMLKERQYVLTPQAEWKLKQQIQREKDTCLEAFSNGRFIRNLIEKALRNQAVRLLRQSGGAPSKQELMALRPEDLPQAAPAPQEKLMLSF